MSLCVRACLPCLGRLEGCRPHPLEQVPDLLQACDVLAHELLAAGRRGGARADLLNGAGQLLGTVAKEPCKSNTWIAAMTMTMTHDRGDSTAAAGSVWPASSVPLTSHLKLGIVGQEDR